MSVYFYSSFTISIAIPTCEAILDSISFWSNMFLPYSTA